MGPFNLLKFIRKRKTRLNRFLCFFYMGKITLLKFYEKLQQNRFKNDKKRDDYAGNFFSAFVGYETDSKTSFKTKLH